VAGGVRKVHYHRCAHKRCDKLFKCDTHGCAGWPYKVCLGCWESIHLPGALPIAAPASAAPE
jgi:hypothetical protein